ncbi:hypothetical protein RvY_10821 [Ramazzottius varieornatus]|uniref:Uncharacterized protein n=1 Tax=Ramazzottius varieornatus TaxID=947166 RepID=A0A1D1VE10_RAMVA|nr:hypothetical protein RvY_10821 [Ramazzottius varieornatus]
MLAVSCTKKDYVRSTRSEEDLNTQLRRCISLFFILGFSWLFLILNAVGRTTEGKMAMYVLVGVFCGLQGVAILVVTVLGMRKELFNRRKMRLAPTSGPSRPATASVHTVSSSSTIETESDRSSKGRTGVPQTDTETKPLISFKSDHFPVTGKRADSLFYAWHI